MPSPRSSPSASDADTSTDEFAETHLPIGIEVRIAIGHNVICHTCSAVACGCQDGSKTSLLPFNRNYHL